MVHPSFWEPCLVLWSVRRDNAAADGHATSLSSTIAARDSQRPHRAVRNPVPQNFPTRNLEYHIPTHLPLVGALVVSIYAIFLSQKVQRAGRV